LQRGAGDLSYEAVRGGIAWRFALAPLGLNVSESNLPPKTIAEVVLLRRFGLKIGLKLALVVVADFVLLAICAPNLVNRHQDIALAGAIACLIVAFALTIGLGFRLWLDLQQFMDARRQLRRGPNLKVIGK
jgi:hypothetical protein